MAALLTVLAALPLVLADFQASKTCSNPALSCHNTTAVSDLCCFNAPGGQLLQTQFWDTDPSSGPVNSWTIHGLWPDHCDGTYDANCDASRAYTNITQILQQFGKTELLSYMNTYWTSDDGTAESFWEHEWGKHGTCISTLKPSCYTSYTPGEEVPDFFQRTVDLFKTVNSYETLENAGIVPSSTKTYTSAAILAALKASFGYEVIIQCDSDALDQIYYSFNVRGSVQSGTFVPTDPDGGSTSNCPASGVQYLPKSSGITVSTTSTKPASTHTTTTSKPTTTHTTTSTAPTSTPTSGGGSFSGTGYLNAYTSGNQDGCLISAGTWYTSGTCATYTATASGSGFTLKSSKGPCGVSSGVFACASGDTATVFTAIGGKLAYKGATTLYAAEVPSGSTQATVYTASNSVSVSFEWEEM